MNRKAGGGGGGSGGGLEAVAQSMAHDVSNNPDDWEKRRKALINMQQAVDAVGESGPPGPGVFTADLWRHLKEPLKHTLNDLRSAIVKEACILLEKLSTVAGNSMAALMRDMLNVLLQLMANGNSVIVGQVDSCMRHVISHSRFPRQLKEVEYAVKNSRSNNLRESVASYVLLMLGTWSANSMEKEVAHVESIITLLLRDASSAARTDARACFGVFRKHWPKRAERILESADPRTAKNLREEYDDLAGGSATGTGNKGGTGGGGGVKSTGGAGRVRVAGAGGGATTKGMARKGPSSAEGLREAASGNSLASPASPATRSKPARKAISTNSPTRPATPVGKMKNGLLSASAIGSAGSPANIRSAVVSSGKRRPAVSPASKGNMSRATGLSSTSKSTPVASSLAQSKRKGRPTVSTPGSNHRSPASKTAALLQRPGTVGSSPLIASADGFLTGGRGMDSTPSSRVSGGGGGDDGGGSSAGGGSVAASEGVGMSLALGDRVRLKGASPRSAVVRHLGRTQFATGIWVGVELSTGAQPLGNNDGTVNGVSYFTCPPMRGIFVRPDMVELMGEEDEVKDSGDRQAGRAGNMGQGSAAQRAGEELLRCHKLFVNEALESLKDEMGVLPGLEGLVESDDAVLPDRLRYYLEVLESAAEAREAAATRLRAQIREAALRHPSVFSVAGEDNGLRDDEPADLFPDVVRGTTGVVAEAVDVAEAGDEGGDGEKDELKLDGESTDPDADAGEDQSADQQPGEKEEEGVGVAGANSAAVESAKAEEFETEGGGGREGAGSGDEVVGVAGQLFRDANHTDPKPGGNDKEEENEEEEAEGAAVGTGVVDAVLVDISPSCSPTTPNAIAADIGDGGDDANPRKETGDGDGDGDGKDVTEEGAKDGVTVDVEPPALVS